MRLRSGFGVPWPETALSARRAPSAAVEVRCVLVPGCDERRGEYAHGGQIADCLVTNIDTKPIHVFASAELQPIACTYHRAWRDDGPSDHSALEADPEHALRPTSGA
jgi:hypothetical protein